MKPELLALLVCPRCGGDLRVHEAAGDPVSLREGLLACQRCGTTHPVRDGIPRFVADGAYARSFGREWTWFRTAQIDSANGTRESERRFEEATGWRGGDLAGRLVLDAGVGAGRFAEIAARQGAVVVGVDLTEAVDAARRNLAHHPRVHLVQADLFALPFRPGAFDAAYSIGVLHHTPDAREAFRRVAAAVRPGGELAVYLYERDGVRHRSSDLLRCLTTRLPSEVLLALTAGAVVAGPLWRTRWLGGVLQLLCPVSNARSWRLRWLDTFDWYAPKYQAKMRYPEVLRWFREDGFRDLDVFDPPICVRGVRSAV